MSDEDMAKVSSTGPPDDDPGETGGRTRRVAVAVAVLVVAGLLAMAYVPRTVASGGQGDESWSLRVTPGVVSPTTRLHAADGTTVVGDPSVPVELDDTEVVQVPVTGGATTLVVGPTPRDTRSLRVTSLELGVGEASITRVGWRRMHVAVLPGDVWVTDLVAIAGDGGVLATVRDLAPPASRDDA